MGDLLLSASTYPDTEIKTTWKSYGLSIYGNMEHREHQMKLFQRLCEEPDAVLVIIHDTIEPDVRVYFDTVEDWDTFYHRINHFMFEAVRRG